MHAGRLTTATGGRVTIEIRPGASSYAGSTRNGVSSRAYAAWTGSFVIVGSISAPPENQVLARDIAWTATAVGYRGRIGSRYAFRCPSTSTVPASVWGTDIYTDDSSICGAAVHAGYLTAKGGVITIEIRPGASTYRPSTRNGVTSRGYGAWTGSFVLVRSDESKGKVITWGTTATNLRGQNGKQFAFSCPPNGSLDAAAWGTDIYTDDSAICVAAVHRGLISAASGGNVLVEVRPGVGSYAASTRNGVASRSYGAWSGSFIFK